MWETGYVDVAHAMAEHNLLDWRKTGTKRIICPDPHDYITIVEHYPELEPEFYDDVARAYGEELRSLAEAGCTYVQLDDTNMAYLCDEKMREAARQRGDDPNELPHRYARFINKVVALRPAGMTLATAAMRSMRQLVACPASMRSIASRWSATPSTSSRA